MTKKKSNEKDGLRQKTHEGVDNILDKAENVSQSGKDMITRVKKRVITIKENVNSYIKKNPEKSVVIAAGVGILSGAILTAILMRKKH
jgi:ElaB/YqjD/DUF883 family membrane-anchored ribosome-binding protein